MALKGKAAEDWKKKNYNNNITVDQSQIDALNLRKTPEANFEYYSKNGANEMEVESLNRFYGKDKVAAAGIGVKSTFPNPDRPNTREDRLQPTPGRPNDREDRGPTPAPNPTKPGFRNNPPFGPTTPKPTTPPYVGPGARGQNPFGPSTPKPTTPPYVGPGARGQSPFGPIAPPDRAQSPDRIPPANPGFRGQSPFGPSTPRPTPSPGYVGPGARGQSPFGPSTPRPTPTPTPGVPGFRGQNPFSPPKSPGTPPPNANTREGRSTPTLKA
jgi:hypothetical protein